MLHGLGYGVWWRYEPKCQILLVSMSKDTGHTATHHIFLILFFYHAG